MNERMGSPMCGCQAFRIVFISAFLQGSDIEKPLSDLHQK